LAKIQLLGAPPFLAVIIFAAGMPQSLVRGKNAAAPKQRRAL
jgi:hypothetical protein